MTVDNSTNTPISWHLVTPLIFLGKTKNGVPAGREQNTGRRISLPSPPFLPSPAAPTRVCRAVVQAREVLEAVQRQLLRRDAQLVQQLAHLRTQQSAASRLV